MYQKIAYVHVQHCDGNNNTQGHKNHCEEQIFSDKWYLEWIPVTKTSNTTS